jgi:hypothetical protein
MKVAGGEVNWVCGDCQMAVESVRILTGVCRIEIDWMCAIIAGIHFG